MRVHRVESSVHMSQETGQAGGATPKDNVCPASTGHDLKKKWILSPIASAARQRHARVSFEAAMWRGVWNLVNVALPKATAMLTY